MEPWVMEVLFCLKDLLNWPFLFTVMYVALFCSNIFSSYIAFHNIHIVFLLYIATCITSLPTQPVLQASGIFV